MSPDGEFPALPWTSMHSIVTGITNNGWLAGPTALCDWTTGAEGCLFGRRDRLRTDARPGWNSRFHPAGGGSFACVELTGVDGLAAFRIHELLEPVREDTAVRRGRRA